MSVETLGVIYTLVKVAEREINKLEEPVVSVCGLEYQSAFGTMAKRWKPISGPILPMTVIN